MTLEDEKLLRRLIYHKAYILMDVFGDMYPAQPNGNKRSRPCGWVEKSTFKRMLNQGWLVYEMPGARVSDEMQRRLSEPDPEKRYSAQHRDMVGETVYTREGVERPANRNRKVSALQRLSRHRDRHGHLVLTSAEVEAGEQFARDYTKSGMGVVASQNYSGVVVDGGSRRDGAELAIISRLDRRKRVSEAMSCLGVGLDRTLIAVCCENWSIEQVERSEKWARNSGLTVLKLGLGRLVTFYGTTPGERYAS